MHPRSILRFISIIILYLAIALSVPTIVSVIYHENSVFPLLYSMLITLGVGLILYFLTQTHKELILSHRDGILVVTFGWITAGLIGALPFMLSGYIPDFTNAYFESLSGFTTTGASILNNIESLPKGILLWRSIIQWLGGMGIIVLSIAILPYLGVGGMQLYKAEIPSPVIEKLKPRISDTAKTLWKVYLLITVIEVILLFVGGMPLFDSICHAFCTMPTGGFSPKNLSIAHYGNPYLECVIMVFMLLAGINFSLHYRFLKGESKIYVIDPECRIFLLIVISFILIIVINLYKEVYGSLLESIRFGSFQVCSIITTTGFVTADFDKWPSLSRKILLICMILGAMAGSTGGGIKTIRLILIAKHSYKEIFQLIHPRAILRVKLGGKSIPPEVLSSIWGFVFLYLGILVLASLIMAHLGMDMISAFSSVCACIFNIGPGLGTVGPTQNYLSIPLIGKWVLIFCMLLGRLEIYTVLVLLVPEFWKK